MNTFKRQLLHWWNGLGAGCVQGGAVALKAYSCAAVAGTAAPALALNWKQGATVFVGAVVYHAVDYVATNALPGLGLPGQGTDSETK